MTKDVDPASQLPSNNTPVSDRGSARQGELFPYKELANLLEVEKSRVDRDNKRTEVMRLFVESSDASDQRQFQYHMAALEVEKEDSAREHNLANKRLNIGVWVLVFLGTLGVSILATLMYLIFWGTDLQRSIALNFVYVIFSAIGGYGLFTALRRWIGRFLSGL